MSISHCVETDGGEALAVLAPAGGGSLAALVAIMAGVWAVNRYFQSMG